MNNTTGLPLTILGRDVSDLDIWRLSRSLDGTKVDVEDPGADVERIYRMTGSMEKMGSSDIFSSPSDHKIEAVPGSNPTELILINNGYYLGSRAIGQGHAWAALALQVETAVRLGFTRIQTRAIGQHRSERSPYTHQRGLTPRVGALQWPKLGFDGRIPGETWSKLPPEAVKGLQLHPGSLISTLMATPEGRTLWADHHSDVSLHLSLNPPSAGATSLLNWAAMKPAGVKVARW